eukprot:jgi/Bigna1/85905/estExt_fgenesh1_pg.C_60369
MTDWRATYEQKCRELQALKEEHVEYKNSMEQVDKQLESQLDMATKKAERLENRLEELTRRIDAEKQKVEMESKGEAQLRRTIEKLEEKARLLQFQHDKLFESKVELDLVRTRVAKENEELSEKLNDCEEENVLLQQDLESVQQNKSENVQRVKDELRDVQHELSAMLMDVKRTRAPNDPF